MIRADGQAEVSVGGRESIRVVAIQRLGACNPGEAAICLDRPEMAAQAERVGYEEEENVCPSQPVLVYPDEFGARSAGKRWECQYERHARSAGPENVCALWGLADSCFHVEIWGRCLWAESIHASRISHVREKYIFLVWPVEVSVPDDHQLVRALDLSLQEKVSVDGRLRS